jgi:mannose-6-phosphate isomerase-like protein (cupin superfamily)
MSRVRQHQHLRFGKGFRVVLTNRRAQVAQMVLAPGDREGDADNRHRSADQWLYVVDGVGQARVSGKRYALRSGTLLLIRHGVPHEIRNTGRGMLKTLSFYSPPGYYADGEARPAGARARRRTN